MVKQKMREEVNYIDNRIIEMAKQKKLIKTITAWVVKECPDLDELVSLSRVISVMKGNGFEVKDSHTRAAFKVYYNKEFHGPTQSYMKWLLNGVEPSVKLASFTYTKMKTSEKRGVKLKTAVVTPVEEKSGLEAQIKGKKWKCPECKRERKYEGALKMKICSCCIVEMEVVR